jgi:hypothetical protein
MKGEQWQKNVEAGKRKRTEEVTRIIALIIAFVSVFFFFVKLLFL